MNKKDWKIFIDTGFVKEKELRKLALKIKKGVTLDLYDLQIYQSHASTIENFLKE